MNPRTLAIAILAALAYLLFPGCASDGSFDAAAFDSMTKAGFGTYDRYRERNVPVYPPVAPFPVYPPHP